MRQLPSMKGEITCSKRHLKGHRSKLSFSRLADPRVTSRLFPRSIVFPRCVLWPTIRLLIASTNLEENRETLANTDFFGHQSTLPKKPKRLPRFCHQGQEADEERIELPNVNSHAAEKGTRGNGKHPRLLSCLCPSRCDLAKSPWNLHRIFWLSV